MKKVHISDVETMQFGRLKRADKLKPVFMDVHLDFHEQLVNKVGRTLARTKKQLHDTELLINLEPNMNDTWEHKKWVEDVNKRLDQHLNPQFPTLLQLKKEAAVKKAAKMETKSRERVASREEWSRRANHILEKQAAALQKKVLGGKLMFGGKVKGEELRTIDNYDGGNTIFKDSRTLIRKDGKEQERSLPPWIGPAYYNPQPVEVRKSDNFYKMPFKAEERRHGASASTEARENLHRRQEAVRLAVPMPRSAGHMQHANTSSVLSLHNLTEDEEVVMVRDMSSPIASPPRSPPLLQSLNIGDRKFSALSVGSDTSYEIPLTGSRSVVSKDPSYVSLSGSLPLPLPSPLIRQLSALSLPEPTPRPIDKMRRKIPLVVDPLQTHHAYALKILSTEQTMRHQRKGKDYTLNALVNQVPLEFHTCDLEPVDAAALPVEALPVPAVDAEAILTIKQQPIPKLKYSSEVFRIKKVPYRSAEQLAKERKMKIRAEHLVPDPFSRAGSPGHRRSIYSAGTGSQPGSARRASTLSAGGSVADLHAGSSSSRPTSSHRRLSISSKPTSPRQSDSEASVTETDDSEHEGHEKSHGAREDQALAAVEENSHGDSTCSMMALPFTMPGPAESVNSSIAEWCRQRGVFRVSPDKAKPRDQFLQSHQPLRSIELSLAGLLLQENPYTDADDLIRQNIGREGADIKV